METVYQSLKRIVGEQSQLIQPDEATKKNRPEMDLRAALLKYIKNIWLEQIRYHPVLGQMLGNENVVALEYKVAQLKNDVLRSSRPYFLSMHGVRATRMYEDAIRDIQGIIKIPEILEDTDLPVFFGSVTCAMLVSLVFLLGMVVSVAARLNHTNPNEMLAMTTIFFLLLATGFVFRGWWVRRKIERAGNAMVEQAIFLDAIARALREIPAEEKSPNTTMNSL